MVDKLFVEGGGDSKALRTRCREGFSKLLQRAGCRGRMPRIVACGSRGNAFEHFQAELYEGGTTPTLLVDAEGPVDVDDPWDHVRSREGDGWTTPPDATAEQLHLMVQLMESWLLADRDSLVEFFGSGFNSNALPGREDIERIPKADVASALGAATRKTRKGSYDKGRHSFELLARVDPGQLERASPWARRFLDHMRGQKAP